VLNCNRGGDDVCDDVHDGEYDVRVGIYDGNDCELGCNGDDDAHVRFHYDVND